MITDRGYKSIRNLEMYIDKGQPMIMETEDSLNNKSGRPVRNRPVKGMYDAYSLIPMALAANSTMSTTSHLPLAAEFRLIWQKAQAVTSFSAPVFSASEDIAFMTLSVNASSTLQMHEPIMISPAEAVNEEAARKVNASVKTLHSGLISP